MDTFGIDWDGPVPSEEDSVVVPEVELDTSDENRQILARITDLRAESEADWIAAYTECRRLAHQFTNIT